MSTTTYPPTSSSSTSATDNPTVASFSPASKTYSASRQHQTIVIHKKSPLLLATPPQITKALAYSHPFILPLNRLVGLLSWTTDDPWESFLLLAGFWAVTLYGEYLVRWTGPPLVVALLVLGMYSRRFSPLSSTTWPGEKNVKGHVRKSSDNKIKHQKSLDEIVDTLRLFTSRCNILLDPFLRLTDFLSTQRTATSATTGPALMTLFTRILMLTPVWFVLALYPFYVVTTQRVVLTFGTIALSWHSKPARASRTILWRSRFVRHTCSVVTGLQFAEIQPQIKASPKQATHNANDIAARLAATRTKTIGTEATKSGGVRFTFVLYENQRRWLGIGWTGSMLSYERAAWTDDHLNMAVSKDQFRLPTVEGGVARWQWVEGSDWAVEGGDDETEPTPADDKHNSVDTDGGWIYYDNKWQDGRRRDGWSKYTRRRKWYRDAELIETTPPPPPPSSSATSDTPGTATPMPSVFELHEDTASTTSSSTPGRARARSGNKWFMRQRGLSKGSASDSGTEGGGFVFAVDREREGAQDGGEDGYVPMHLRGRERGLEADWGVSEDVGMELG